MTVGLRGDGDDLANIIVDDAVITRGEVTSSSPAACRRGSAVADDGRREASQLSRADDFQVAQLPLTEARFTRQS